MIVPIPSGRFKLRNIRLTDAEKINSYIRDPRIYRSVGQIPPSQTVADTTRYIEESLVKIKRKDSFAKVLTDNDDVLGCITASMIADRPFLDVGYWIVPKYWGRGIATEAVNSFVNWLFSEENIRFVTAGYFVDNPASGRVLSKSGFLACGRSKFFCLGRKSTVECIDMALCV